MAVKQQAFDKKSSRGQSNSKSSFSNNKIKIGEKFKGIYVLEPKVNFSGNNFKNLRAIADFDLFESTMRHDQKLSLPSEFIHEVVNIDKWNNIPIPLVKSTEAFKSCFENTSNIISEVLR